MDYLEMVYPTINPGYHHLEMDCYAMAMNHLWSTYDPLMILQVASLLQQGDFFLGFNGYPNGVRVGLR